MKRKEAIEFIEALKTLRSDATDKTASVSTTAYPTLKQNGELVKAGTRIKHDGKLLRATVDLWDTEENSPENAPTLWEELQYKDGVRIIPGVITAGTAFAMGEQGWWNDELYTSLINANVYTPDAYPAGWTKISK